MDDTDAMFGDLQQQLDRDTIKLGNIQRACKVLDDLVRDMTASLEVIHYGDAEDVKAGCAKAKDLFLIARIGYNILGGYLDGNEYYRYHKHWSSIMQQNCYAMALTFWLESGLLISRETVAEWFGIGVDEDHNNLHLDVEDYAHGLLQLGSELIIWFDFQLGPRCTAQWVRVLTRTMSELAVTTAKWGDHRRRLRIYNFVIEIHSNIRFLYAGIESMLKLISDMKDVVRKVETVVYDVGFKQPRCNA